MFGVVGFLCATAAEFRVPGSNYPAQVREDMSVLPGGRVLRPFGRQVLTGTAPFAIAVSASGKTIVTANVGISTGTGVNRPSITVISPGKHDSAWSLTDFAAEPRQPRSQAWQGLTAGLVLNGDGSAWVSEGDSGRVVEIGLSSGSKKSAVSLNSESTGSFTAALAYDSARNLLIALDQAKSRATLIDVKRGVVVASAKTGPLPSALALSGDGKRLYVASAGDGEKPSTSSLSIIDLGSPAEPRVIAEVPLASDEPGGAVPAGIAVNGDEVYVSLSHADAIAIVNGSSGKVTGQIQLRIPGLESYRGITPLGLAFDPKSGRLLVAEAGINAVAVIDPTSQKVVGRLPVGWFPTSIAVRGGQIYVASARGRGTGPSSPSQQIHMVGGGESLSFEMDTAVLRRGNVSAFGMPEDKDLAHQTDLVMQANGFVSKNAPQERPSSPVRFVVLVVKGNRSFDEILGDVDRAGDKVVLSEPTYARYGGNGYVSGGKQRFSLNIDVTPNHHEIARRWSFADNFYADSDYAPAGLSWLSGRRPDQWSEATLLYREAGNKAPARSPISGAAAQEGQELWRHLASHGIDFRTFGEGPSDLGIPDQRRADEFIAAIRKDYLEAGKPLPRFLWVTLPGDATAVARPDDGYPYEASHVADNDLALGRIVEFLSRTPWWKEMALFAIDTGAEGGADHVDSHRTVLLGAGPWFRSNYVSHTNSSVPALLRTIFRLFDVPPINLYDATAGDLMDMFGAVPDFTAYDVKPEDSRLFDPAKLK